MLRTARLTLVLVIVLTVQTTWMTDLGPFGVPGDLLLLMAAAGGIAGGARRGAVIGFTAGLLIDSVQHTPFGLSALAYLTVGYAVGSVHEGVLRSAAWIPVVATFAATAIGIVFLVVLGQLVGQNHRSADLTRIVLVTAVVNTVLSPVAVWLMRWIEKAAPDHMLAAR